MKYIIEINDEPFKNESLWGDNGLYKAVGFNSLVFDRNGLDKLVPYDESAAEQRGQEEAWELARKIAFNQGNIREILLPNQPDSICCIFDKFSYAEAREKCDSWKKQKDEIKVGDEVERDDGTAIFVVTSQDMDRMYMGFTNTGVFLCGYKVHKTGRHFPEVAKLLEKMGKPE